jgi:biotin carboxyl carrier protein
MTGEEWRAERLCHDLSSLVADAARQREAKSEQSREQGISLIAVPIMDQDQPRGAISVAVLVGKEPLGAFLVVTQFVAELASQWFVQRRLETVEWEADAACALAELTTRLAVQQSNVGACRQLAVDLQRFANSGNVFVGLRKSARHACLLAAVSAAKSFDRHGELTAAIQPVLDVAASADTLQMYSGPFALESTPKGLHRLGVLTNAQSFLLLPLRTEKGISIGACVLLDPPSDGGATRVQSSLRTITPAVASILQAHVERNRHPLSRLVSRVVPRRHGRVWQLATIGVLLLVMCIHWPYRLRCTVTLQPESRRFVAAPLTAKLLRTLAEPGDLIAKDQILASLEREPIESEIATVAAEHAQCVKRRDEGRAQKKVAATQIAELEIQRCDSRLKLLNDQLARTDIRSPIAGVLLTGDLTRAEGAPVTIGQPLFEVGPLERMLVELEIPPEEVTHVRTEQTVDIYLEAFPGLKSSGTIRRIWPRAEMRDGRRVFVADSLMANDDELFRPGMTGVAHVHGDVHSIGWTLFHRPWNWLRMWIGG